MHTVLNDLRFALRQLWRSPAFALTAILTLALGIGANTAIFSLLDQALLRALPVHDPQSLVVLEGTGTVWEGHFSSHGGPDEAYFSYPMYKDLRDSEQGRKQIFSGLLTTSPASVSLTRGGNSQIVDAEVVSGNYFNLLGVPAAVGRVLTPSDDAQRDGSPVAVLSFDAWKTRFGSDPSVVGSQVALNGHPFTIIGVARPGFRSVIWGPHPVLFVPMAMLDQIIPGRESSPTDHSDRWLNIIGRLQPGISTAQAEAAMNPLWHSLRAAELQAMGTRSKFFTDEYLTNSRLHVLPGAQGFSYDRSTFKQPLLAIMAMAVLVLGIAVVNVASLLLVRSATRLREFSLRYALGAQPGRILKQLLLEGVLIGIAGGTVGMLLAPVAIRALVAYMTSADGGVDFSSALDSRVFVFNFGIALAVSVLFSLAPAWQLRRPNLSSAMGQRTGTGSSTLLSFRRVVVCLQIGLSVLLLVGAGLFVRTMQKLRSADVGFTPGHLVTFAINPRLAGYAPTSVPQLNDRILAKLTALPGVSVAGVTDDPELAGNNQFTSVSVAGHTSSADERKQAEIATIGPGYFATLQVPLVAGRLFTEADDATHPLVSVVNESFAKRYCVSAQACVGRMMSRSRGNAPLDTEIVGVVRDAKHTSVRDPILPSIFVPIRQNAKTAQPFLFYYLRTYADPAQELPTIRQAMQQLDPALAVTSLRTMDAQIDEVLSQDRIVTLLAVSFGGLATVLAGVGLYGVLAYSTAQRTREIGIRMALGSTRLAISNIVVGDVLRLAGLALAASIPVALLLARLVSSELYGVSPADPLTVCAVVVLVTLVAIVSAAVPAGRAATINPTEALRTE